MASAGEADRVAKLELKQKMMLYLYPYPFRILEPAGTIASVVIFLSNLSAFLTLAAAFGAMAMHGHAWPCMAMHGHIWPCMAMHGQTFHQKGMQIKKKDT